MRVSKCCDGGHLGCSNCRGCPPCSGLGDHPGLPSGFDLDAEDRLVARDGTRAYPQFFPFWSVVGAGIVTGLVLWALKGK